MYVCATRSHIDGYCGGMCINQRSHHPLVKEHDVKTSDSILDLVETLRIRSNDVSVSHSIEYEGAKGAIDHSKEAMPRVRAGGHLQHRRESIQLCNRALQSSFSHFSSAIGRS